MSGANFFEGATNFSFGSMQVNNTAGNSYNLSQTHIESESPTGHRDTGQGPPPVFWNRGLPPGPRRRHHSPAPGHGSNNPYGHGYASPAPPPPAPPPPAPPAPGPFPHGWPERHAPQHQMQAPHQNGYPDPQEGYDHLSPHYSNQNVEQQQACDLSYQQQQQGYDPSNQQQQWHVPAAPTQMGMHVGQASHQYGAPAVGSQQTTPQAVQMTKANMTTNVGIIDNAQFTHHPVVDTTYTPKPKKTKDIKNGTTRRLRKAAVEREYEADSDSEVDEANSRTMPALRPERRDEASAEPSGKPKKSRKEPPAPEIVLVRGEPASHSEPEPDYVDDSLKVPGPACTQKDVSPPSPQKASKDTPEPRARRKSRKAADSDDSDIEGSFALLNRTPNIIPVYEIRAAAEAARARTDPVDEVIEQVQTFLHIDDSTSAPLTSKSSTSRGKHAQREADPEGPTPGQLDAGLAPQLTLRGRNAKADEDQAKKSKAAGASSHVRRPSDESDETPYTGGGVVGIPGTELPWAPAYVEEKQSTTERLLKKLRIGGAKPKPSKNNVPVDVA